VTETSNDSIIRVCSVFLTSRHHFGRNLIKRSGIAVATLIVSRRVVEKYTAEKFILTLMTADPPHRYRLMRPVGPRRAGPLRVQRYTNLPRYPTRATSRRLWAAGCERRTWGPRVPRVPPRVHARQYTRLNKSAGSGYAINVDAATPYGPVRATVRCPLSPRGRPPVRARRGKKCGA